MPCELLTERHNHTLVLTIQGSERGNALSDQVPTAGIEALNTAGGDVGICSVVLQGAAGDFSVGEPAGAAGAGAALQAFLAELRAFPKPVIACVEGRAFGSGLQLALACDLLVAARDARFAATLPSLLGAGGAGPFASLPRSLLLPMACLGEALGTDRLEALGLVHRVAESGQALTMALRLAAQFEPPAAARAVEQLKAAWARAG